MKMYIKKVKARIKTFPLNTEIIMDASVIIPTVKGSWWLKYGKHAYYFLNFRTGEGFCVEIPHGEIIKLGEGRFKRNFDLEGKSIFSPRGLTGKYHYGFNALEQIMLMTVPHTATSIGNGRFIINLWSYFGYILVDCVNKTVTYHVSDDEESHVLGSQQWFDPETQELYAMSYSLEDSSSRIQEPRTPVSFRIFKHRLGSDNSETVWDGDLADYMHDIVVNKSRRYGVVCELVPQLMNKLAISENIFDEHVFPKS